MNRTRFLLPLLGLLLLALPQSALAKEKEKDGPPVPQVPETLTSEVEPTELNGVYWGMAPEEVGEIQNAKPKSIENVDSTWLDRVANKPCTLNFIYDHDSNGLAAMEAFYDRIHPEPAIEGTGQGEKLLADFAAMQEVLTGLYGPVDGPVYLRENQTAMPPPDDMAADILRGFTILRATWALPNTIVCMELYPNSLISHQLKKNIWTGVQKERKVTKELGIRVTFASREFYPVIVGVREQKLDDKKKNKDVTYPEVGRGEPEFEGKKIN